MAKMFYTIEETAQKLGMSVDQVKDLAGSGKLQQFRDRDKLMFKRDQVDGMNKSGKSAIGDIGMSSGGPIELADSGDTDAIDLKSDSTMQPNERPRKEDPRQATGVSVFDADEIEPADPSAQTQVTQPVQDDEELALESVGSGSGLLDLTRESDDTSLGAELLDEIYPGSGGEAAETKTEAPPGSSGAFEGAIQIEPSSSGLDNLAPSPTEPTTMSPMMMASAEAYDPAGSGMSAGFFFGAMVALILGLMVVIPTLMGVPSPLVKAMTANPNNVMIYCGVLLVVCIIFGLAGFFVGKSQAK